MPFYCSLKHKHKHINNRYYSMSSPDSDVCGFNMSPIVFSKRDNVETLEITGNRCSSKKPNKNATNLSLVNSDDFRSEKLWERKSEYPNGILDYYQIPSPRSNYRPYDAISNCKSAGVIPYTYHHGELHFLFQRSIKPTNKKNIGWNDFGGKRINNDETTADIAAREFCEETSCLFYLKEKLSPNSILNYELFKDNPDLSYDEQTVNILREKINEGKKYFSDKITEFVSPIHTSSKETYISYFVKVEYIPETDIPRAEDIHIDYDVRYLRECKWISVSELLGMNVNEFHKRLQITKLQRRIACYCNKDLFC